MVRLPWQSGRGGRHRKPGIAQISEEMREVREEQAEIRDALTALRVTRAGHGDGGDIPLELDAAMHGGHQHGKGLIVDIGGEKIGVVVGDEGRDPGAVWDFLLQQLAS